MTYLSPTQISCYLRCPKQYEFRYIEGLKIPPSGAMVLGSAYHEAVAQGYRHKLSTNEQAPAELLNDTFDTSFERIKSEHLVKDEEEDIQFDEIVWDENPGKIKDAGIRLLTTYRERIMPSVTPVLIEHQIIAKMDEVVMVMIVDLTTPETIVDHKVKSRRFTEDDLRQDIQASAYSLALDKPLEFHVALKTVKPEVIIQRAPRTKDDQDFFVRQINSIQKSIQSGVFYPNTSGWWCNERWCGYYNLCRKGEAKWKRTLS